MVSKSEPGMQVGEAPGMRAVPEGICMRGASGHEGGKGVKGGHQGGRLGGVKGMEISDMWGLRASLGSGGLEGGPWEHVTLQELQHLCLKLEPSSRLLCLEPLLQLLPLCGFTGCPVLGALAEISEAALQLLGVPWGEHRYRLKGPSEGTDGRRCRSIVPTLTVFARGETVSRGDLLVSALH